jgi:hypothetical protein
MPETKEIKSERHPMFAGRAGSIRTLRSTYRDKSNFDRYLNFLETLGNETDRAAIILVASFLDDVLSTVLAAKAKIGGLKEREHISRLGGPMGSFAHRIEIACLFGHIDQDIYCDLEIIREMRNACAHSIKPLSFASEEIKNVVNRLHFLETSKLVKTTTLRELFVLHGAALCHAILEGSLEKGVENAREVTSRRSLPGA